MEPHGYMSQQPAQPGLREYHGTTIHKAAKHALQGLMGTPRPTSCEPLPTQSLETTESCGCLGREPAPSPSPDTTHKQTASSTSMMLLNLHRYAACCATVASCGQGLSVHETRFPGSLPTELLRPHYRVLYPLSYCGPAIGFLYPVSYCGSWEGIRKSAVLEGYHLVVPLTGNKALCNDHERPLREHSVLLALPSTCPLHHVLARPYTMPGNPSAVHLWGIEFSDTAPEMVSADSGTGVSRENPPTNFNVRHMRKSVFDPTAGDLRGQIFAVACFVLTISMEYRNRGSRRGVKPEFYRTRFLCVTTAKYCSLENILVFTWINVRKVWSTETEDPDVESSPSLTEHEVEAENVSRSPNFDHYVCFLVAARLLMRGTANEMGKLEEDTHMREVPRVLSAAELKSVQPRGNASSLHRVRKAPCLRNCPKLRQLRTILPVATVAERLTCLPPSPRRDPGSIPGPVTPDFRIWESYRTMPLVGGLSRGSPVSPALSFQSCSILASLILIVSQDLDIKSRPNLFTHYVHRGETVWRFLLCGCAYSPIGCAKLWEWALRVIGYCPLRKVRGWLDCRLAGRLPGADWRTACKHFIGHVVVKGRAGETGDTRRPAASSGTIPTCENPGATFREAAVVPILYTGEDDSLKRRATPHLARVGNIATSSALYARLFSVTRECANVLRRRRRGIVIGLCVRESGNGVGSAFCIEHSDSRRLHYDGNTEFLARRSDEALGVRVTVARIAPSLLDHGRAAT
ncbi:hypothetical protein PR048_002724 [Dryococelus australis]|uniref:Uncharacterized protein n=1 Tax=Dryococelus australis TaxID=614101 RepID=A0ABQ9IL12_9NEOP|nr:hypothetical protein PR048_002724 [Dryococelus australis]